MTPHQKDILFKLLLGNLIVYVVLDFFALGPPLPQLDDLTSLTNLVNRPTAVSPQPAASLPPRTDDLTSLVSRPTAVAIQPTKPLPRPTVPPTSTPAPSPTLVIRPVLRSVRPPAPPAASPAPPTAPAGDSPSNPMTPSDSLLTLGAGGRVWFIVGSGGVHMDVFLEANPLDGLTMEVYAPGQFDQPIGHGTFQAATGRLVWAGGHWQSEGNWLARVTNGNPVPVQYKLTSSARDISNKSCYSYWENIGTERVYWTECR